MATIFIILAAVSLLAICPAMGQDVQASSSGVWTAVSGGSGVTGIGNNEVRWGNADNSENPGKIKSGLRFDGQPVNSAFGQEFCLGKLTHFNWPISNAANGATLKVTLDFSTPAISDASFTYNMGIDETSNGGICGVSCAYSPCDRPCPDKISWPPTPPTDQTFNLGDDTYTLQILGIKDSCSGGSSLPYFITQEKKNNEGYLVGRIVLTSRPDAIDDVYTTKTNVPLTVAAPGVLGNDFEKSGLDLDVVSYTQPAHGTVTVDLETGSMTYTPNADFCGTDTFTYKITNGQGKYDEATVTITVVCDDNNKCTIDACVDGVCTHTAVSCDDSNICTDDSCDPATGECIHDDNTAPCDDGNFCTVGDVCAAGSCSPGTLQSCDDGVACTTDTCNEQTDRCDNTPVDSACNDGDLCNGVETCNPIDGCKPGTPLTCSDNNICNGVETCNPATGCVQGTPLTCNDNNVCNGVEECDPVNGCTNPADLVCNNGLFCDGLETCDAINGCQDGADPLVDDGVACTDDSCDEANDKVVHTPVDSRCSDDDVCNGIETCNPVDGCQPGTDLTCDNGLFCDGLETCDSVAGCQDGADPVIDDNVACTDDACDETNNVVTHTPNDGSCSNNDVCDGIETCDPVNDCQDGTPLTCDNGLFCDGLETCDSVAGCQDGADPVIDDNVACTDDACDETNNVVTHTPNDGSCSNNDVCDGIETCDPVNDCQDGTPLTCDNGLFCDGLETCDSVAGCLPGTAPNCDDDAACTTDSCNEDTDSCDNVADDTKCDDNDACTIDTCDAALGCQHEDVICNDNNLCTNDECVGGACVYTPVDCDDGDDCTADSCDPATGDCINTPINCHCPEAEDDEFGVPYTTTCSPLAISISNGILINDLDLDGDDLTAVLLVGPSHGTLTLNPDGSFTYKPARGFVGTDSFTYRAYDGHCYSEPATVTLYVAKCPWTISNELYSAVCGADKVVAASEGLLANDASAIAIVNPELITIDPKYGTIEVEQDGSFVYHAAERITSGTYVQFKYTATNGVCEAKYQGIAKIQVRCS